MKVPELLLSRTLEGSLRQYGRKFPVILVTGARQVGKSTLLKACLPDATYVSLDDPAVRILAQTEPKLFLARFPAPVIIDEVQYAPELFPLIKLAVDQNPDKRGQYWLSGSQQFHMMKNVSESMAGRVGILQLAGLSTRELLEDAAAPPLMTRLDSHDRPALPLREIFQRIWRGSYPAVHAGVRLDPAEFYPSYVQTYLERDVRDLARVGDERAFLLFMRLAAARTGQLVNVSELANAADVSSTAARSWLSILEASGIIRFLEPLHVNPSKRLVKTPKMYFLDTGLAAWFGGWPSPEVLERGAMAGAFLETYVITEVLKSYQHQARHPTLGFYRDHDSHEVDLIVVEGDTAFPLEVKMSASPDTRTAKRLLVANKIGLKQGPGAVVCMTDTLLPITENVTAVPAGLV